jgi:hypothetical protein
MAEDQQAGVESEPFRGGAECFGPGPHDRQVGRPGDVGDHPVAEPGQMGHGRLDAGPVVTADRRQSGVSGLTVDQDDRLGRGREAADGRSVQGG